MLYDFRCARCGDTSERRVAIDERDNPQFCRRCGGSSWRVFTPSMVNVPAAFMWDRSTMSLTREQCIEREKANDRYLASRPPSKPTFEQCLHREFDKAGIRTPHKMIDPKVEYQPSIDDQLK